MTLNFPFHKLPVPFVTAISCCPDRAVSAPYYTHIGTTTLEVSRALYTCISSSSDKRVWQDVSLGISGRRPVDRWGDGGGGESGRGGALVEDSDQYSDQKGLQVN